MNQKYMMIEKSYNKANSANAKRHAADFGPFDMNKYKQIEQ